MLVLSDIVWNYQFDFQIFFWTTFDFLILEPLSFAGKHLSIHLCCKLLCCQITLMEGILMYARSKFMDLGSASSTSTLCIIFYSSFSNYKYSDWSFSFSFFAFPVNDQFRNPFPNQPFQFTSREFITYSSVRWETWPPKKEEFGYYLKLRGQACSWK